MCSFSFGEEFFLLKRVIFSPGQGVFDFGEIIKQKMWPLAFECVQQTACPQQAQTAGRSSLEISGATRSLVPRAFLHRKAEGSEGDDISRTSEPSPVASAPHHWLLSPLRPLPRAGATPVRPCSEGARERLCTAHSPRGARGSCYSGFASPAWIAGAQPDIRASTTLGMKERNELSLQHHQHAKKYSSE